MNERSFCFTFSSAFGVVNVLDFGHSNRYRVVSHCCNLHFPDDIWCGASFISLFASCVSSLVRCPFRSFFFSGWKNTIPCFYLYFCTDEWSWASLPVFKSFFCELAINILHPLLFFFFFFLKLYNFYLFIYLFVAVLGLHFCARAFSSCDKWGPLFILVRGPLIIAASLVVEHRLQTRRLSSCGSLA